MTRGKAPRSLSKVSSASGAELLFEIGVEELPYQVIAPTMSATERGGRPSSRRSQADKRIGQCVRHASEIDPRHQWARASSGVCQEGSDGSFKSCGY